MVAVWLLVGWFAAIGVIVGCVCCVVSGAAPVCGVVLWFVLVVDGGGGPPGSVPIPVAKPIHADGTAPGGVWESRLPPTLQL